MTKILITGASGLLGPYLTRSVRQLGNIVTCGLTNGDRLVDLRDRNAVERLMQDVRPDFVFHCAAFTDVDECENNPDKARALNHMASRHLVENLSSTSRLIYFSTDQVYPDTEGPHAEGQPDPVNAYGRSKLDGETEALAHARSLVFRVNFFGRSKTPGRHSLSDWITNSLHARKPTTLFTDSLFSPLHMETLSDLVVDAVTAGLSGVYNLGCREGASKCDFALAIAAHLGLQTETASRGKASQLSDRARRSRDLRMDVTRIEESLGKKCRA